MTTRTPAPWGLTGNGYTDCWIVPASELEPRGKVVKGRIAIMQKPGDDYPGDNMRADAEHIVYCVNEMAVLENLARDPNVSNEAIGIRIRNNLAR